MTQSENSKGNPPLHTTLLLSSVITMGVLSFPSSRAIDEYATVESFTKTANEYISLEMLIVIRFTFAMIGMGTTVYNILFEACEVETKYLPHSKLRRIPTFYLTGLSTQSFFTTWAWNLLTLSFLLSTLIPLLILTGHESTLLRHPIILRTALIAFETSAPAELFVACLVRYLIWPYQLSRKRPGRRNTTRGLRRFTVMTMHNMCVVFVLTEVYLLGTIPFVSSHASGVVLLGAAYVLFSWGMRERWTTRRMRRPGGGATTTAQFLYPFLDTTLGVDTTLVIVGLLILLLAFHFSLVLLRWADDFVPYIMGRMIIVGLYSSLLCRFRD